MLLTSVLGGTRVLRIAHTSAFQCQGASPSPDVWLLGFAASLAPTNCKLLISVPVDIGVDSRFLLKVRDNCEASGARRQMLQESLAEGGDVLQIACTVEGLVRGLLRIGVCQIVSRCLCVSDWPTMPCQPSLQPWPPASKPAISRCNCRAQPPTATL
jgi:hypothetical protein